MSNTKGKQCFLGNLKIDLPDRANALNHCSNCHFSVTGKGNSCQDLYL